MLNTLLAEETPWYPIRFDSPLNAARAVFFWLTIAFIAAIAVAALLTKGDRRKLLFKIALIAGVCYACVVGIVLLCLTFAEDGISKMIFVPTLILLLAVAGSALVLYFNRSRSVVISAACIVGASFIALMVCAGVLFASGDSLLNNGIVGEDGNPDPTQVNQIALYVSAVLYIAAVIAVAFLCDRRPFRDFDSKAISYAAVCIALSFALSYLRILKMPQGGSITIASLLPLMIYAYMFGTKKGVFAGMIYGILQAFQDFYVLHPAQFILDYPAAFACIGLAGLFADFKPLDKLPQLQFAFGGVIAGLARFVSHFLSGCFAFGAYAPAGTPVWIYSLGYQAAYVLPDIAIAIAVGILVFSSKAFLHEARKFRPAKTN